MHDPAFEKKLLRAALANRQFGRLHRRDGRVHRTWERVAMPDYCRTVPDRGRSAAVENASDAMDWKVRRNFGVA